MQHASILATQNACTDKLAAEAPPYVGATCRRSSYAASHAATLDEALRRFLFDRKLKGRAERI
jgi:hypothetical protein